MNQRDRVSFNKLYTYLWSAMQLNNNDLNFLLTDVNLLVKSLNWQEPHTTKVKNRQKSKNLGLSKALYSLLLDYELVLHKNDLSQFRRLQFKMFKIVKKSMSEQTNNLVFIYSRLVSVPYIIRATSSRRKTMEFIVKRSLFL